MAEVRTWLRTSDTVTANAQPAAVATAPGHLEQGRARGGAERRNDGLGRPGRGGRQTNHLVTPAPATGYRLQRVLHVLKA